MASPHSYSSLENPMDRGAWGLQSMGLQRVGTTEHLTLSLSFHFHFTFILKSPHISEVSVYTC